MIRTEKRVYASSSRGEQFSSIKGCVYSPYFGIPGEKLIEAVIDRIMKMLVSGLIINNLLQTLR